MDRQQQQQQAEPIPPSAEKRTASLTSRQRVGVGIKRSTTPTPQRLSFAKPSSAHPTAAGAPLPPASAPSPHNSGVNGAVGAAATTTNTNASKYSFGKPLGDPPNAPLPRIPTDKKKPASSSSSSSNHNSGGGVVGRSSSNNSNNSNTSNDHTNKDWLADTEAALKQDLETTKKELELIRTILWEMEMEETSSSPPPPPQAFIKMSPEMTASMAMAAAQQRSQRKMLMAACREYAESRRQLLRERLRQVQFWTGTRDMGRRAPAAGPGDWAVADAEWAKWLSDQAVAMQQQLQQQQRSLSTTIEGDAVATWGPLPHILATFTFSADQG